MSWSEAERELFEADLTEVNFEGNNCLSEEDLNELILEGNKEVFAFLLFLLLISVLSKIFSSSFLIKMLFASKMSEPEEVDNFLFAFGNNRKDNEVGTLEKEDFSHCLPACLRIHLIQPYFSGN